MSRCEVCRDRRFKKLWVIDRYRVVRCDGCGFVFVHPSPSEKEIEQLYRGFGSRYGFSYKEDILAPQLDCLSFAVQAMRKKGSLLEIGAGAGFFLTEAEKVGFNVFGVEPSHILVRYAREHYGLHCFETTFEKWRVERRFDVVVMFQLIEHVRRPRKVLRKVYNILHEGGYLLLQTPNIESLEARIFGRDYNMLTPPEHLNYFSPRTIRRLVEEEDFRIVRLRTFPATGLVRAALTYWFFSHGQWREQIKATQEEVRPSIRASDKTPFWKQALRMGVDWVDFPLARITSLSGLGPMVDVVCRKA